MTPARASDASGDWAASRQTLRGAAGRREVRESTRYTPQTRIRKTFQSRTATTASAPAKVGPESNGSGPRTGFRLGFRRRKIAAKAARAVARTTPSTRAARARRAIDAEARRGCGWRGGGEIGSPVGPLWLGGFDQHSTQCGRRRENLRGFHDARTIAIKNGIGQVARVKDRNCGGTWELDYLGGGLRGWRLGWLRVRARFGDAPRAPPAGGSSFAWTVKPCPARAGAVASAVDPVPADPIPEAQLAAQGGTSSRAHQKAGAARDSAESEACAACDSVRGDWQPRCARNQRSIELMTSDQRSDRLRIRPHRHSDNVRARGRSF